MTKKTGLVAEHNLAELLVNLNLGYLTERSILHLIENYGYKDLHTNLGAFKFDYFLPVERLVIEFDGDQHFKPIEFFNQNVDKETLTERDLAKINFCKLNDIKIIHFDPKTTKETAINVIKQMVNRPKNYFSSPYNAIFHQNFHQSKGRESFRRF